MARSDAPHGYRCADSGTGAPVRAIRVVALAGAFALAAGSARGQQVELSWTPPPGNVVAGYNVYMAPSGSGPLEATPIDVGRPSVDGSGVVKVRLDGIPYTGMRFEVASYDAFRRESARSNRVMLQRRSEYLEEPLFSAAFEDLAPGAHPDGFVDSPDTFSVAEFPAGNRAYAAPVTEGALVTRWVDSQKKSWDAYEVSGRMYMMPGSRRAGVGVRVNASVPWTPGAEEMPENGLDELYSGYTFGGDASGVFSLQQRSGVPMACVVSQSSGVPAWATRWYRFRIRYTEPSHQARVRAKIWRQEYAEPLDWQVDCWTEPLSTKYAGVFALYREGTGAVYWDDLEVRPVKGWHAPDPFP